MLEDLGNSNGSFVDFGDEDLSTTPDITVAPDNTEAKLRLSALSIEVGRNSGNPYLLAMLEIVGYPDTREVRHMMMLPTEADDAKKVQNRKRAIKYFGQAFGIPLTGRVDFDKYLGREATAILGVETDDYGDKNRIKRWVAGA